MSVRRRLPPTASPLPVATWLRALLPQAAAAEEFAAALRAYLGVPYVFAAASGRTALRLLLETLRLRPALAMRYEVALPGYTCPSVAKVILDAGLTPHPVEMDPATLNMTPEGLAAAVGVQTLAVMVVHPFGLPVDTGPAAQAAAAHGALLIEDAAQSMGARQAGIRVGTAHDVGLYSFGPGKPLSLGGGGLLATRDGQLAAELAASWAPLAPGGVLRASMAWARLGVFTLAFAPRVWGWAVRAGAQRVGEHEGSWGYGLRGLTPSQAAVGASLLGRLDGVNRQRRARAEQLRAGMAECPGLQLPQAGGVAPEPIYLRLPILTATEARARTLTQAAAGLGAGRVYQRTLAEFFPKLGAPVLEGASTIARTLVTLPTHHHVTDADADALVKRACCV